MGAAQDLLELAPRVKLRHQRPMILQGATAAQFHGWRQFAVLDRKIAVQNFELADLLKGR